MLRYLILKFWCWFDDMNGYEWSLMVENGLCMFDFHCDDVHIVWDGIRLEQVGVFVLNSYSQLLWIVLVTYNAL